MTKTTKRISLILGCFISCTLFGAEGGNAAAGITARENLEKLVQTKSCKGCNLSGLNLNRMDLAGVDLEGADLSCTTMFLNNLAGANLQNSTLTGAKFGGADLGDADLRGADLRGASLDGAYLGGANLDGEFVTDRPFEEHGITEFKKDVYVEDQAKPKQHPEKQEVKVGERRDFEEPPPQLAGAQIDTTSVASSDQSQTPVAESAPKAMALPLPPAVKTVRPVRPVVVEETEVESAAAAVDLSDNAVAVAAVQPEQLAVQQEITSQVEEKTSEEVEVKEEEVKETIVAAVDSEEKPETPSKQSVADTVDESQGSDVDRLSTDLAMDKKKRDNLSRLLDRNRCYGCDLSGLDLSGKDFEGADLEKADLSGCNLVNADLEEANLKGAILQNADIRNADLRETDFYRADLTDADLTGSKMQGAQFDGAVVVGTRGIDSELITTD